MGKSTFKIHIPLYSKIIKKGSFRESKNDTYQTQSLEINCKYTLSFTRVRCGMASGKIDLKTKVKGAY